MQLIGIAVYLGILLLIGAASIRAARARSTASLRKRNRHTPLQTAAMLRTMAVSVLIYVAALTLLIPLMGNHWLWAALMVLNLTRSVTMWAAYPKLLARV